MDDKLDNQLSELTINNYKEIQNPSTKRLIIINIVASLFILVGLSVLLNFLSIKKGNKQELKELRKLKEENFIKNDVPTDVDGKIPNSFKRGGANYNDIIGNLNGGQDFDINERNYFDYCIPERVKGRKNKHNILYLQVHGGGWIGGNKEDINLFCDLNANNSDAITVVMT